MEMKSFITLIQFFIITQFYSSICQELSMSSNDISDSSTENLLSSTIDETSNITIEKDISTETQSPEKATNEVGISTTPANSIENSYQISLINQTFSDSVVETTANPNEVLQQIGMLSKKILELVEPLAVQTDKYSVESKFIPQNSPNNDRFFLSFMFDNRQDSKNSFGRKMTVNNNFHGNHLIPSQVFVESGSKAKQISGPNVQMTSPNLNKQMPNNVPEKAQGQMDIYKLYGEKYEKNMPMPYYNGKSGPVRQV